MRREIYVAYGFWTGYPYVKVNVEDKNKSPMPVVIGQSGSLCVLWVSKNYGSAAILISLFRTSKYDDFCTFRLEKSVLALL